MRAVDDHRRDVDAAQPPVAVVHRRRVELGPVRGRAERVLEPPLDVLGDAVDACSRQRGP